jgi:RimJ/RimL family protein N-acetyltransferase
MKIFTETERLILRELQEEDAAGILAMDKDPEVLRFLPGSMIDSIEEAVQVVHYIRKQYEDNGIGRWAMVRKEDQAFIGWCGIKWVNDRPTNGKIDYYDIGYRMLPAYWGQGYGYEAAASCMQYGFEVLLLEELCASVMEGNTASMRIMEKLGMQWVEQYEEEGSSWNWYVKKRAL